MIHNIYKVLLILGISVVWIGQAAGKTYQVEEVPNPKARSLRDYVSNPDGIIAPKEEAYINRCAQLIADSTMAELAVVAIENIGEQEIFDFTYRLFQHWGIGKEGKNTGILICFVLDSHDIRIMTGTGIEGVLPDATCKRIIEEEMIPSFRNGNYGEGLALGALRILEICSAGNTPDELLTMRSVTQRQKPHAEKANEQLPLWLFGGFLLMVALIAAGSIISIYRRRRCPKCGKHMMRVVRQQVISKATYEQDGVGVSTMVCKHCGHRKDETFRIPRLQRTVYIGGTGRGFGGPFGGSSMGGGSFGGGSWGGGSTSGGGAGGRW